MNHSLPLHSRHRDRLALWMAAASIALTGCVNLERSRDLANPDVSGRTLAEQVCANCHGAGGDSVSPNFPKLAGQTEQYLIAQLTAFKSQARSDPAGFEYMWGLSRNLTEGQIQQLATYYASRPTAGRTSGAESSKSGIGDALFHRGIPEKSVPACASCHGEAAQGNAAFPRLAGQHADYVAKQLVVFQRTDERPEGAVMKVIAHSLSGAEIEDLSLYLESLPGR